MPNEDIPTWTRDPTKHGSLTPLRGSKYKMIDAHLHVVNFIQETPGGNALIEAMDKANVDKAVIFGLPGQDKIESHPTIIWQMIHVAIIIVTQM